MSIMPWQSFITSANRISPQKDQLTFWTKERAARTTEKGEGPQHPLLSFLGAVSG